MILTSELCTLCLISFAILINAKKENVSNENKHQDIDEKDEDLIREEQNYHGDYTDNLPGNPQIDYPLFTSIPRTGFSCEGRINWQYYADVETDCQVFHICESQYSKISFLCPEGSVFNQKHLVCDWWYNVDCTDNIDLYTLGNRIDVQDFEDDRGPSDLNLASSGGNKGPNDDQQDSSKSQKKNDDGIRSKTKKGRN